MTRASILIAIAVAGCGRVTAAPDDPPSWSIDHATHAGALLGVWGTGPDDVWAVGGEPAHALVVHGDGTTWTGVGVNAGGILFSVYGFARTDVYAVGEAGLILHYDGAAWSRIDSGTTQPLFGLWGASGDDVWIVGGDTTGSAGSAVVLRGNAHGFAPVQGIPAELMPNALFKVHGFAADNVMMVGNNGVVRWTAGAWSRDAVPTAAPLFSTWGRSASDYFAVGGFAAGEILHSDGAHWTQMFELQTGVGLSGVFATEGEPAIAVGANAHVFEIDGASAIAEAVLPDLGAATLLHAVWGDGAGTTYVAGSDYPLATTGVILRRQ